MKFLKTAICLAGGVCWFGFGAGFVIFLWQFVTNGAGLQLFGDFIPAVSSGSLLFGLVYFVGLSTFSILCFVIGIGLLTRAKLRFAKSEVEKTE